MKSIQFETDQLNMAAIFSSENFYGSWKVFLRELLQNACDACYTRQALIWSWGSEFLQMEEAQSLKDVRKPYVPKITIELDSSAHTLSIEDNGIGMNESDLLKYVAKLGGSFYTSEEFTRQRLSYQPVSRYGMGMCSCFIVARALLIESKKDGAINTAWNVMDKQKLDGIMVKWFGDSHEMQYVNTKRQQSGTRVTLFLRPAYEKKINQKFLFEGIQHYMLYQKIPMTIICDGEEHTLYQPKAQWRIPFADVMGITTIEVDNDLMEGYLVMYHDRHKELIGDSVLYQQNFLVTEHVEMLELKPIWLQNFMFCLNVKKRLLNLTMSRVSVTEDGKLEELRQQVGMVLVRHFAKAPLSLAQYLYNDKQPLLSRYEQEAELVSRAIQVRVFVKSQEVEVTIRTVVGGYLGRKAQFALIHHSMFEYYRKHYKEEFETFVGSYDCIIFEKNVFAFMQFLSSYLEHMQYVVRENSGIIYTEVAADLQTKKETSAFRKKIQLYPMECQDPPVFCLVDNLRTKPLEVVINTGNKNARLLADAEVYPKVRNLRAVIIENIKRRILGTHRNWKKIMDFGGTIMEDWESEDAVSVQAMWCLEPNFPELVNEFIASKLTEDEIRKWKLEELHFTQDDFISWWFSPQ